MFLNRFHLKYNYPAILLREGFEAVLIIIALLGVIRASGTKSAHKWVHGGWMAALAKSKETSTWKFAPVL